MRRPHYWLRWLFFFTVLLIAGQYAALSWLVPRYVMRELEHLIGGEISIGAVDFAFPLTTTLRGIRFAGSRPEAAVSIQRVVIRPRWLSVPSRTLWVDAVEIEKPLVRLKRTRDGDILWPRIEEPAVALSGLSRFWSSMASWRVRINSLKMSEGALEFTDEKPLAPFHGVVDHISIELGEVRIPPGSPRFLEPPSSLERHGTSFAGRAKFIGDKGNAAPLYCSGWAGFAERDLEMSCRLEPLTLAALEPYTRGPTQLRTYATTLSATSQWLARSNDFVGRIQLELGHLTEADLSVRGRTVIDFKRVMTGQEPRLRGEITLTGRLDRPSEWRAAFVPGDEIVQHLVKRLLDRGVEIIKIPLPGPLSRISIAPASKAVMTDMEAASKEVQEALEILALPIPELAPEPEPSLSETPSEEAAPSRPIPSAGETGEAKPSSPSSESLASPRPAKTGEAIVPPSSVEEKGSSPNGAQKPPPAPKPQVVPPTSAPATPARQPGS